MSVMMVARVARVASVASMASVYLPRKLIGSSMYRKPGSSVVTLVILLVSVVSRVWTREPLARVSTSSVASTTSVSSLRQSEKVYDVIQKFTFIVL